MSLGKSSSMAAMLLLVAVVAGTFASGAQAKFDINNYCHGTVVIKTANDSSTLAFAEVLPVTMSPKLFFSPPVRFEVLHRGTVVMPRMALDVLNHLGERVLKISIGCDLDPIVCINFYVTYQSQMGPPATGLLGRFCRRY